ncbi:unnamed protein product [Spodoptera littoralis]|uniref:Uncharacterized protein n=1 Tax=Spodoptera littoralis TaxID=7109 RepID=A0A9P0N1Y8_SPOLI|nr:unnamed protein product [Spodoptera littoralis]CAH1639501.1 unnamed protein product [Spodoptera littoralis]
MWMALRTFSSLFSAISSCAPPRKPTVSRSSSGYEVLHGLLARLHLFLIFIFLIHTTRLTIHFFCFLFYYFYLWSI